MIAIALAPLDFRPECRVHRKCPCAARDAGGKFQPHSHCGSRTEGGVQAPPRRGSLKLSSLAPTWQRQVRNTVGTRQRRGFDLPRPPPLYLSNLIGICVLQHTLFGGDDIAMVQPIWLLLPAVAIVALIAGFVVQKLISERKLGEAGARATRIVGDAERDAEARHRAGELEAKEIVLKARGELDTEVRRREREIQQIEQRIIGKEEQLARKLDDIERRLFEYTSK